MSKASPSAASAPSNSVAAVVVNWNGGRLLLDCVKSLRTAADILVPYQTQIVVWDNASTDGSLEMLGAHDGLVVYKSDTNLGFGVACNRVIEKLSVKYILLINPDLRLDPYAAVAALSFLEQDKAQNYGGCGVALYDSYGNRTKTCARIPSFAQLLFAGLSERISILPNHRMRDWDHCGTRDVDHVIGACLLLRKDVFTSLNGFDESYPLYLEDLDFSTRLKKRGLKIRYLDVGKTMHIGGGLSRTVLAQRTALSMAARVIYSRQHFGHRKSKILDLLIRTLEMPLRSAQLKFLGTKSTQSIKDCYSQAIAGRLVLNSK